MTTCAGDASPNDAYQRIERVIEETTGAQIAEHLAGRVSSCVDAWARRLGLSEPLDVLRVIEAGGQPGEALLDGLLAEILVHETFFYRFASQLQALELRVLAPLCQRGSARPIRIWSAGCSRGPEAYTLAMIATRATQAAAGMGRTIGVEVLGTDLCVAFLDGARRATYSETKLRELPPDLRDRFLVSLAPAHPGSSVVADRVRALVTFERHNLLDPPPGLAYDVVSCRNVLMYLRPAARRVALEHLAAALDPGGVLLMGHSESLRDSGDLFAPSRHVGPGIYHRAAPPSSTRSATVEKGAVTRASAGPTPSSDEVHVRSARHAPSGRGGSERAAQLPATLALEGDYDNERGVEQLARLKQQLGDALDLACDLLVDADGATCLDHAAATLVTRAARAMESRGRQLLVVTTRPAVQRWATRHRLPLRFRADTEGS
jgi:chemotaxis protein methyltransferase CheR